ncbi:MAG: DUF1579 family protein, partial [Planctomycetota bacterium]
GQPGQHAVEHAELAKTCGDYTFVGELHMMPGQPPQEMTGTAKRTMIMNGYYLQEDFKSTFMGQPFEGRLIHGYDTINKEHVSVWIDCHSPYMTISRGNKKADALSLVGMMPDMMSGNLKKTRSVVKVEDQGKITYSSYDIAGGEGDKDRLTMKITYKKQGAK